MGPETDDWGMEDCGEGPGQVREGAVKKLRKDRCTEECAKAEEGRTGGLNAKEPEL